MKKFLNQILSQDRIANFSLYYRVLAFLASKFARHPSYESRIRGLLPEILGFTGLVRLDSNLNRVLERWEKTGDADLKAIAVCLRKAIQLQYLGFVLVPSLVFGLPATGIFATKTALEQIEPPPEPTPARIKPCPTEKNIVAIVCNLPVSDIDSKNFDGGTLVVRFQDPTKITENDEIFLYTEIPQIPLTVSSNGTNTLTTDHLESKPSNPSQSGPRTQAPQPESSEAPAPTTASVPSNLVILPNGQVIGTFTRKSNPSSLELTFNQNANPENMSTLLGSIVYQNTNPKPQTGERKIVLDLTDGDGGKSDAFEISISVQSSDQKPVLASLPNALQVNEDNQVVFGGLTIQDPDIGKDKLQVQLSVNSGYLWIDDTVKGGLTPQDIVAGQQGSSVIEFEGTVEQILATLKSPKVG
jgi:hypothetical protein